MATTTTNFGWDIPQSTDLVKDGATAIAALGQDIDTAMVDLKGGTTGQVLAKASGADLDFSWVAQDDANAIQNTQLTAKGALISAVSAGTPTTLTVGTNGQVLTADSTTASGLKWAASGTTEGGAFSVYRTASQTISNSTITKVQFNTEAYDAGGNWDSSTNYRFTPTVAGYYALSMGLQPESGSDFYGYLYKNGSVLHRLWGAFGSVVASGTAQVYLNGTTDYIEFYTACFTGSGNIYGGQASCWAMGSFMRGA